MSIDRPRLQSTEGFSISLKPVNNSDTATCIDKRAICEKSSQNSTSENEPVKQGGQSHVERLK